MGDEEMKKTEFKLLNNLLFAKLSHNQSGIDIEDGAIDVRHMIRWGLNTIQKDSDASENILLSFEEKGYWKRKYPKHPWYGWIIEDKINEIKKELRQTAPTFTRKDTYKEYEIIIEYTEHGHIKGTWYEICKAEIGGKTIIRNQNSGLKEDIDIFLRNEKDLAGVDSDIYVFDGNGDLQGGLIFVKKEKIKEYLFYDDKFLCTLDELPSFIREHPDFENGEMRAYWFAE